MEIANITTKVTIINSIKAYYDHIWDIRDKRMDNYFLAPNPLPTLLMCILYILFSAFIGPLYMKNRKPINVNTLIIIYNVCMIVINAYLCYTVYDLIKLYEIFCAPVDYSNNQKAVHLANLCYYYFLTKLLDWFDTLFFVLKKKFGHITFLHLYHHCCMPINGWIIVHFVPGGQIALVGLLNTLVHTVMYTYYALAALGPKWQKYLWWKKYITILQMMQFVIITIQFIYSLWKDCGFPKIFLLFYLPQVILLCILFANFYIKAYKKKHE